MSLQMFYMDGKRIQTKGGPGDPFCIGCTQWCGAELTREGEREKGFDFLHGSRNEQQAVQKYPVLAVSEGLSGGKRVVSSSWQGAT